MIVTTTHGIEGRPVVEYLAIVTGQAILGANILRDIFAGVRNIVGGRSGAYEKALGEAKDTAIRAMEAAAEALGAHAVLAVDLDYETVGSSMLMVSASGTAVRLGPSR